jgi:photosystem II stability/assembly factor-like uncharacterized protein
LLVDPATPATLYAGTYGGGIFKSTDSGGNWDIVNAGLVSDWGTWVTALAIDPVTPTILYAGTDGGLFKSTDGGGNWDKVNTASTAIPPESINGAREKIASRSLVSIAANPPGHSLWMNALVIDPAMPTTLYAGTTGGVLKSRNAGETWNAGLTEQYVTTLAIDPASPTTLYAGTLNGVFKSTDGGETWHAVNPSLPFIRVNFLIFDSAIPTTLYAATDSGLFAIRP